MTLPGGVPTRKYSSMSSAFGAVFPSLLALATHLLKGDDLRLFGTS